MQTLAHNTTSCPALFSFLFKQFRQGHSPFTIIDNGPSDEHPYFILVSPPDLSLYGCYEATDQIPFHLIYYIIKGFFFQAAEERLLV